MEVITSPSSPAYDSGIDNPFLFSTFATFETPYKPCLVLSFQSKQQ